MTFPFGAISAYFGWGTVSFREGRWNTFPRKREEMSMLKEVAPDMYPTFLCSQYLNEKLKNCWWAWLIARASKYSNIAPMTTAFCLNTLSRVMRTSIPHNKLMITVVMWRDPGSWGHHIIKSYTTSLENTKNVPTQIQNIGLYLRGSSKMIAPFQVEFIHIIELKFLHPTSFVQKISTKIFSQAVGKNSCTKTCAVCFQGGFLIPYQPWGRLQSHSWLAQCGTFLGRGSLDIFSMASPRL